MESLAKTSKEELDETDENMKLVAEASMQELQNLAKEEERAYSTVDPPK